MASIINEIIEIDSIAQKKLDEAYKLKEKYLRDVQEKIQETNTLLEQKTKERITDIHASETENAKKEMDNMKYESDLVIERLNSLYEKNHKKLEDDIFNNIIQS